MTITRGPGQHGDEGLSEVIGFVIIFGIIVILFSNYMLYGIPAQGRDSEISHMNDVKDQFVDYKVGLDSLFNNNKVGTTISNSFTLGTGGSYATGANSLIPMISPIKSSGTIAINERTPEYLTISSQSLITSASVPRVIALSSVPQPMNYTPSHIYVKISNIDSADLASGSYFGTTINGNNWNAIVNMTPQSVFYYAWNVTKCPENTATSCIVSGRTSCIDSDQAFIKGSNDYTCLTPLGQQKYGNTQLQISILKNNVLTTKNYAVYNNITAGATYTIDLMDSAYGLNSFVQPPDTISLVTDKPLGSISATGNVTYAFNETMTIPYNITLPLGALEYRAQNNYWISQDYYYQLGGIFVTQNDGNSTYRLPPEITFSNDTATNIVTVNINALLIDQNSHGIVGGNSPVQIKTILKSNQVLPYVAGTANTRWVRIGIITSDSKALAMWRNYFNYSAMSAGIPNAFSGNTTTESYIFVNGSSTDTSSTAPYDINVIAANATFSTTVQGIGGT